MFKNSSGSSTVVPIWLLKLKRNGKSTPKILRLICWENFPKTHSTSDKNYKDIFQCWLFQWELCYNLQDIECRSSSSQLYSQTSVVHQMSSQNSPKSHKSVVFGNIVGNSDEKNSFIFFFEIFDRFEVFCLLNFLLTIL